MSEPRFISAEKRRMEADAITWCVHLKQYLYLGSIRQELAKSKQQVPIPGKCYTSVCSLLKGANAQTTIETRVDASSSRASTIGVYDITVLSKDDAVHHQRSCKSEESDFVDTCLRQSR